MRAPITTIAGIEGEIQESLNTGEQLFINSEKIMVCPYWHWNVSDSGHAGQLLALTWNMVMNGVSHQSVTVQTVASIVTLALNSSFTQRWVRCCFSQLKENCLVH